MIKQPKTSVKEMQIYLTECSCMHECVCVYIYTYKYIYIHRYRYMTCSKFAFQSIIAYFSYSINTLLWYIVGLEDHSSADLTRGTCFDT